MKKINYFFMTLILLLSSISISFSSDGREIIKAYENGKPAKLDIEVTKVRSNNNIDLFIDKSEKKIYRDITKSTRENSDLDRKLYVTTYLKPSNKSNTINDELPYKIITIDGKRYLEISYFEEPKNIYLWVVKNNKVEKLYTGILKDLFKRSVAQNKKIDTWFNYEISKTSSFTVEHNHDFSTLTSHNGDLTKHEGEMTKAWTDLSLKFIRFTITVDGNTSPEYILGNYKDGFEITYNNIDFKHEFLNNHNKAVIFFTPNKEFQQIVIKYEQSWNNSFNKDIYVDTLTINGNKKNFSLSATTMDFGEFYKNKGAQAESVITIHNGGNLDYSITKLGTSTNNKISDSIKIYKVDDSNSSIDVFLNTPNETSKNEFKITGIISEPLNTPYTEGEYKGNFQVTVTAKPNPKGGRF